MYTFSKSIYKYWFYIENADSVVEIHPKDADGNRFFLFRNLGSKYDYAYKFSDGYLSEIADTMRRRGITPYKISHEYIVNSTKSDFTLRCVMHGALDSEFFIPAGDSVEVERRWIMESDDISGSSRYEFAFADSVVFVYPCDAIFSSVWPKRYFVSTTSRSGGGMRRYEISEELLEFIASYMNCLREARPEWF